MSSPFTIKTLRFLRALKRNNDREWFRARKDRYEEDVRQPMIALLDRLAADFPSFAPEFIAEPKVSLYRIYRDTRFSADKTPLKTHVAAHFPMRGMPKGEGAGLYFEIAPRWVWMGGGLYMPSNTDLHAIRSEIAATHPRLHRLVTTAAFRRTVGTLDGERLSRVPRGYANAHPAADYLRFKQFLAGCEFPAEFATGRSFYRELLATFRAVVPLVRFLNAALPASPKPHSGAGGLEITPGPLLPSAASRQRQTRSAGRPQVPAPMW
jgi:uncharacterized protein (TIGR02453 family)